jgi:hypothetical protein
MADERRFSFPYKHRCNIDNIFFCKRDTFLIGHTTHNVFMGAVVYSAGRHNSPSQSFPSPLTFAKFLSVA